MPLIMFGGKYKEIANPLVLLLIIIIISYVIDIKSSELLLYSFTTFFLISFLINIILVLAKIVDSKHYLFVYVELCFSLIFLIPLFYLSKLDQPILSSLFVLGITDFIIQGFYNIMPRKDGKKIVKLWKNKLIKSERIWLHAVSLQRYVFNDFTCEIMEPSRPNPTVNHVTHHDFMVAKTKKNIIQRKFGNKNAISFDLENLKVEKNEKITKRIRIDKKLYASLKRIDKEITKNVLTCHQAKARYNKKMFRIVFDKDFVLKNPTKTYDFLKKINEKYKIS